jgi:hypothetical protein
VKGESSGQNGTIIPTEYRKDHFDRDGWLKRLKKPGRNLARDSSIEML